MLRSDDARKLRVGLWPIGHAATPFYNKSSAVAEMGDRGHNRHGPKRGGGGAVPLSRSAGNPSNTMRPAPMTTPVPSGVFIHRAVWPQ